MSYRDFIRGSTPEQIQARMKEEKEAEELRWRKENERRMKIVRGIEAWNKKLEREKEKLWRECRERK